MKEYVFVILAAALAVYLTGCGKKQSAMDEMQEPASIESLSAIDAGSKTAVFESRLQPEQVIPAAGPAVAQAPVKLEPLPPSGPYKPTNQEIQTALKNAGLYLGPIDGKRGPKTTKAIEDFQKENGLKVDGKVGPKTWAALCAHLNPPVPAEPVSKKKQ